MCELPFQRIKSVEDLNAQVAAATAAGKTVMLDFYADWCVSCKEMENYTFPHAEVRNALANTVWLQADVTANDDDGQGAAEALRHLSARRPSPSMARMASNAANFRVVGFMKAEEFAPLVARALQ